MSNQFAEVDYIWMNGELVEWENATVHSLTHCLMYGSGVFEGIRCYNTTNGPAVFRLTSHVQRLFRSAKILRIPLSLSVGEIEKAIKDTIKANNLKKCYIRPLVFYGYHLLGINPGQSPINVVIAAFPLEDFMGPDAHQKGIRCTFSSWIKTDSTMVPAAAKACGTYLNNMMAKIDAVDKGFPEALMLDSLGHVAEACTENIFIINNDIIYTPGVESSILPGITRDSVIKIARDAGYTVIEKNISIGEVLTAEEIFLTGTAAEVTPVREIDFRMIGEGTTGPITRDIQQRFFRIVKGDDKKYADWLDPVELI